MISVIPDTFVSTCPNIKKYKSIEKIGEGWFGQVFKAEHRKSKNVVAMKKLSNLEIPSIASSTYRRINVLKKCKHENILKAIEICKSKKSDKIELFMIMPLYDYNLAGLIQNPELKLTVPVVKNILHQLLRSVSYIHGHNIIHRNLKPTNIFITNDGVLKIGDFGLACCYWSSESVAYTSEVFAYRAPELLLGSQKYDRLVDMWSVGCIFAELFTKKKMFSSDCLQTHLELISDICGSICSEVCPDVENLKLYKEMDLPQGLKRKLKNKMKKKIKGNFGIDLLDKLLILHSKERISASEALSHRYFGIKPPKDELVEILLNKSL